ncbi:MAG: MFS transporter [Ectothiorhodospiraceae bacterium]|nr:MFS transporter [Ectothiorhodospiraceae bacterium]
MAVDLGGFRRIAATLAQPNYGIYTLGNAVSLIGTWVQRIAVGWLAWDLTGSGAWLGLVAAADLVPAVLVGPVAGAFADRVPRLAIIRVSQMVMMVQAVALAVLTAIGVLGIHGLLGLVLLGGVVMGINQPARLALIPSLVPRDDLATAVAINSIMFNLARFLGPAIAGVLIVHGGVAAAFAVNAGSFVAFLVALSRLRIATEEDTGPARRGSIGMDVVDGVRYAARHPGIGPLLLVALALSLGARPYVELLPGFAAAVFGRGAGGLATLASAIGIGAILGGLWLAQRPGTASAGSARSGPGVGLATIALGSAALGAAAVTLFALTERFALAVAIAAASGAFMVGTGISVQILLQMAVAGRMRGRVMSLYGIIFRAGPAAGALAMGIASEWVGLGPALAVGAAIALGVASLAWLRREAVATGLAADAPDAPPAARTAGD